MRQSPAAQLGIQRVWLGTKKWLVLKKIRTTCWSKALVRYLIVGKHGATAEPAISNTKCNLLYYIGVYNKKENRAFFVDSLEKMHEKMTFALRWPWKKEHWSIHWTLNTNTSLPCLIMQKGMIGCQISRLRIWLCMSTVSRSYIWRLDWWKKETSF